MTDKLHHALLLLCGNTLLAVFTSQAKYINHWRIKIVMAKHLTAAVSTEQRWALSSGNERMSSGSEQVSSSVAY